MIIKEEKKKKRKKDVVSFDILYYNYILLYNYIKVMYSWDKLYKLIILFLINVYLFLCYNLLI